MMKTSLLGIAALSALLGAGCAMDATGVEEGQADEQIEASQDALTVNNVRLRNSASSLCLQVNTALTVLATSPCTAFNPYNRWHIKHVGGGNHIIRPKNNLNRCMTSLSPEASAPVISPCNFGDLQGTGQLFKVTHVGGGNYRISPLGTNLRLSALQPNDVFLLPGGTVAIALQRWKVS